MLQIKGARPMSFRDSNWPYKAKPFSFDIYVSEAGSSSSIRQNILNLPQFDHIQLRCNPR